VREFGVTDELNHVRVQWPADGVVSAGRRHRALARLRASTRRADPLRRPACGRLKKTLEEMKVKLTEMVSDVVGQTGMKILQDIVAENLRGQGSGGPRTPRISSSGRAASAR
jgi:hypothetical protein